MRQEFYKTLSELMERDPAIYLLSPDFSPPQESTPLLKSRTIKTSLTEQATVGIAAGMALQGLKPYVIGIAPFLLERAFEQIKLDIVQQRANVTLVGYWDYPTAGITHLPLDVSGLCHILKLKLYQPNNSREARDSMMKSFELREPSFFYLTKDRSKTDGIK